MLQGRSNVAADIFQMSFYGYYLPLKSVLVLLLVIRLIIHFPIGSSINVIVTELLAD